MTRAERLKQAMLEDRAEQERRRLKQERSIEPREGGRRSFSEIIGFDPYTGTKWGSVTGGDAGYFPKTPMRMGPSGFFIFCSACGKEFESLGLKYCKPCLALPAEERYAMKPAYIGRLCEGPGCENFIPRAARANVRFCSDLCQDRAYRARKRASNAPYSPAG